MSENPLKGIEPRALGARLREARESRGLTQTQVAEHLKVARTTLVAIEKGDRRLKPAELIELAGLYDQRVSELLQRGAPVEGFGALLRRSLPSTLGESEMSAPVESFQHLCEDYSRLEEICEAPMRRRYPPEYEIQGVDPEIVAEDVANSERHRLGLGEGPLLNLRETLESDVGLRVFQIELPSRVAGMFAFSETLGGCMAVNLNHPPERRRHSLGHEYGHFLTSRYRSEITLEDHYRRMPATERFAEGFARAFLMPASGLRRRYLELERGRPLTHGDLCRLAHFYCVAVEAMIRRLEELRLIPVGTWERLRQERFSVQRAKQLLGIAPTRADENPLPPRYVGLAVEAWQIGELSEGQLARYLRTDRIGAREAILRLERSSGEGGSAGAVDLSTPLVAAAG
ncbi:MAG: ImmA/IrrE family metallo-endopeptidase [bacterium]|nr:ImmA/IrrE family metallo-endopeptidase [bacterium]